MMRGIVITSLVSIVVANVAWLAAWAYAIDGKTRTHELMLSVLITPNGDIRPSTKVEVLEERVNNIKCDKGGDAPIKEH